MLIPVFLVFGVELHTAMATALLLNAIVMAVASATFIRKSLVEWRLVLPMLVVAVLALGKENCVRAVASEPCFGSCGFNKTIMVR